MEVIFNKGIPGFENLRKFNIDNIKENESFKIISSIEENISFIAISPFDIDSSYDIYLNEEIINELKIKESTDVMVLNIVTLGSTLEESTANLKAPIIINIKNNLGKQFILQNDIYETKHPLSRREQYVSNY